jgi:hypothetical protein
MKTESWLQCIVPSCGKKYSIIDRRTACDCGELLDVRYKGVFPKSLQETFSERLNHRQNFTPITAKRWFPSMARREEQNHSV